MLAGLMLVVLLILVVLQGTSGGAAADLATKKCYAEVVNNPVCYDSDGQFVLTGVITTTNAPSCTATNLPNIDATPGTSCGDLPANLQP